MAGAAKDAMDQVASELDQVRFLRITIGCILPGLRSLCRDHTQDLRHAPRARAMRRVRGQGFFSSARQRVLLCGYWGDFHEFH